MSVTFSVEALTTGEFVIDCYANYAHLDAPETVARANSYDGILALRDTHMATCEDCSFGGCYSRPVFDVNESVNFANGNARAILFALDLDSDDLCGSTTADDMIARIVMARAIGATAATARPTVEVGGTPGTGARFIDCGATADEMEDRFSAIEQIAVIAQHLGRSITWA